MQNITTYKESYLGDFRTTDSNVGLVRVTLTALGNTAERYEIRVEYGGDRIDQLFRDTEENCSEMFQRIMLWPRLDWDDLRSVGFTT